MRWDSRRLAVGALDRPARPRSKRSRRGDAVSHRAADREEPARRHEPGEARRQALVRFGGVEAIKEQTRDEIRPALLEDVVARRPSRRACCCRARPASPLAALVTLALGIGATSAIFSVVRTVMLEPLPYHEPDRLVTVWETNRGGTVRNVIAPANFVAWRERSRSLEHLGMVGPASVGDDHRRPAAADVDGLDLLRRRCSGRSASSRRSAAPTRAEEDYGGAHDLIVLESRVLAAPSRRPRACSTRRSPPTDGPHRHRHHAAALHRRRPEVRLPDSVRADAGADARGAAAAAARMRSRGCATACRSRQALRRDARASTPTSSGSSRSATPAAR